MEGDIEIGDIIFHLFLFLYYLFFSVGSHTYFIYEHIWLHNILLYCYISCHMSFFFILSSSLSLILLFGYSSYMFFFYHTYMSLYYYCFFSHMPPLHIIIFTSFSMPCCWFSFPFFLFSWAFIILHIFHEPLLLVITCFFFAFVILPF